MVLIVSSRNTTGVASEVFLNIEISIISHIICASLARMTIANWISFCTHALLPLRMLLLESVRPEQWVLSLADIGVMRPRFATLLLLRSLTTIVLVEVHDRFGRAAKIGAAFLIVPRAVYFFLATVFALSFGVGELFGARQIILLRKLSMFHRSGLTISQVRRFRASWASILGWVVLLIARLAELAIIVGRVR